MSDIWFAYGKTESGDDYMVGYWSYEPSLYEVYKTTVDQVFWEINAYGIDMEWARNNPEEACEEALLYPKVVKLGKIEE